MNVQDYATKTIFIDKFNVRPLDKYLIGLDVGYSAVKGFAPNKVFSFPSFARKINGNLIEFGKSTEKDIYYRENENSPIWEVGALALSSLSPDDNNDNSSTLCGRIRYYSDMFLVLARTGIALALLRNNFGGWDHSEQIVIQTGLPPAYQKEDSAHIKNVLSGRHEFEIKYNGEWHKFSYEILSENVKVMAQPMGSLLSAAYNENGESTDEAENYFAQKLLVLDGGFGTLDLYTISNRKIESKGSFTYDDLGMKAILEQTADEIYNKYNTVIPIHYMQNCLNNGYIDIYDIIKMSSNRQNFDDILESKNREICNEALNRIKVSFNYLKGYNYILVTGGTGAAWLDIIEDHFKNAQGLKVITANQNDCLNPIFSNVRGYYLLQYKQLKSVA